MSTITKERLQKLIRAIDCGSYDEEEIVEWVNSDEILELARFRLASLKEDPVAYADPQAFRNFQAGAARREWMWRNPGEDLIALFTAPPAPVSDYPETLPCPVMLEPGLRFGKGVPTKTMLGALQRRAEYYAELEAMTPDQRAQHDAGMKELAAMLQGSDERYVVRSEHAEWSQSTFGDVGPVGPLKHLSKEALEAAAEPGDLSEWADMQFLLWDAQRRAGITDEQITLAMIEKLAVNKARIWPEPKDGEPRLHIKAAPQQEVKQALAKGMERYGDAMQELAKKEVKR